jgi:hypothetical protein
MSRGSALLQVGVYAVITALAVIFWGLAAGMIVGFFSLIVLAVGFAALAGGDWFRDASAGRFERRDRR